MNPWLRFGADEKGSLTTRVAYVCGAIAIGAVTAAQMLATSAQDGAIAQYAAWRASETRVAARAGKGAKDMEIDYEPTASIGKRASNVVVDPCNGKSPR